MKKIFLIFAFLLNSLHGEREFECISIGEVCSTAAALNTFNLRKYAYPFDWVISSFDSLYNAIQDDFADFLNPSYFHLRTDNHGIINKYGLVFVHDFLTVSYPGSNLQNEEVISEGLLDPHWLTSLPAIQSKYNRRIHRLKDKLLSNKKVYLFRHLAINREQAIKLRTLLRVKYPKLDFVLVAIANDNNGYASQWGDDQIKNYSLNSIRQGYSLQCLNDIKEWRRIFQDLDLLSDEKIPLDLIAKRYAENLCKKCTYCKSMIND